jgi:hypothetical protein
VRQKSAKILRATELRRKSLIACGGQANIEAEKRVLENSASADFEALAQSWEASSVSQPPPSPLLVARMYLWIHSAGAKQEGVSERLRNMVDALRARLEQQNPDWYENQMMEGHDYCRVCGERYRCENLSICTHCSAQFGPCHRTSGGLAHNGNYRCGSCGVGEIVG